MPRMIRRKLTSGQNLMPFLFPLQQQAAIHCSSMPHQAAVPEPIAEPVAEQPDWKAGLGVVRNNWT